MPPLGDERLRHLGRAPQDDGGARQAGLQAHAGARNARDHRLFALGGRILPRLHHVQRADDGRQRVAQLVAEHGEEFVLGARGVLRALQQALVLGVALLQRAARQHLRGDVGGDRHQPLHAARQVVHRLDGELEPALGQVAIAQVQPHERVGAGVAHVGAVGVVQPALRRGGSQLGKGLAVGFAEQRFFRAAQDVAVQRVGQREHVARPAHDGHGDGRLVHQVVTLGIGHAARAAAFGFGQATAQLLGELLQKLPVTSSICGPMMG